MSAEFVRALFATSHVAASETGAAMSGKLSIRCVGWRHLCKNTLRGFATIQVAELRMTMREVAVHEQNGKTWAQPPSRPWVKEGQLVRGQDGKVQYSPLFEFDNGAVRAAFSDAVVRAVLTFDAHALECGAAAVEDFTGAAS